MSDARRVLLDEYVPGRLKRELPGFAVRTVRGYGRASKLDGKLLRDAEAEFDVLVTVDRYLVHQQNPSGIRLAIVVPVTHSNDIRVPRLLVPELLEGLPPTRRTGFEFRLPRPGEAVVMDHSSRLVSTGAPLTRPV